MNDKKLWKAFSEFIRLRDSDENGFCKCFTCGRVKYWRYVDCGHGIPRQHRATKYSEFNNHAQCKHCNGLEGGKREIYKENMDKKYGEGTWDKMEIASKKPYRSSQTEFDVAELFYKSEVQKLKKQKGL